MFFKKNKQKIDKDLLLRANIAQGIKYLYLDRSRIFYPENKHYQKLKYTFEQLSKNIRELESKKPRMLIMSGDHFDYEVLDKKMGDHIIDYFEFLLQIPPPTSIFSKWKKAAELGRMRVPTLSYILNSLLTYKIPDYWRDNIQMYTDISAAIIEIFNDNTSSQKMEETTEKVKQEINKKADEKMKEFYKNNILEWIRLGLLI